MQFFVQKLNFWIGAEFEFWERLVCMFKNWKLGTFVSWRSPGLSSFQTVYLKLFPIISNAGTPSSFYLLFIFPLHFLQFLVEFLYLLFMLLLCMTHFFLSRFCLHKNKQKQNIMATKPGADIVCFIWIHFIISANWS